MIFKGEYIGDDIALKGKTALLMRSGDRVKAQFDDVTTGKGHGWHEFSDLEFRHDEFERQIKLDCDFQMGRVIEPGKYDAVHPEELVPDEFDLWLEDNAGELNIAWAESGADREPDARWDRFVEREYENAKKRNQGQDDHTEQ